MLYVFLFFLIIVFFMSIKPNYKERDFFNKMQTNALKGYMAIFIFFHHLIFNIEKVNYVFDPFIYVAFPLVSIFLFLSGYGLIKSYLKHNNSLKGFISNRCKRLLSPYIIIIVLLFIYILIINDCNVNLFVFIKNVILAKQIGSLWYMTVIISLYFVYYIVFRFFNINIALKIILVLTIIYIALGVYFQIPSNWYASIIGFYLGIKYGMNEEIVNKFLSKNTKLKFYILLFIFLILFAARLIVSKKISSAEIIHGPYRNILCICFAFIIIMFLKIFDFNSKILSKLGKYSYEIYIIHPIMIFVFRNLIINNNLFIVITVICTILLSISVNHINNFLLLKNKLNKI